MRGRETVRKRSNRDEEEEEEKERNLSSLLSG